jgi:hypothetical protein
MGRLCYCGKRVSMVQAASGYIVRCSGSCSRETKAMQTKTEAWAKWDKLTRDRKKRART